MESIPEYKWGSSRLINLRTIGGEKLQLDLYTNGVLSITHKEDDILLDIFEVAKLLYFFEDISKLTNFLEEPEKLMTKKKKG